jgi:uncharacterized repeat protein (TIGR01451 family)
MNLPPPLDPHEPPRGQAPAVPGDRAIGTRSRWLFFAVFSLVCVVAAGAYVVRAVMRQDSASRSHEADSAAAPPVTTAAFRPIDGPALLFNNLAPGNHNRNRAAVVPLVSAEGPRGMTRLACQRVHFAGGRGLCLGEGGGTAPLEDDVIASHGYVFGADFQITHDIPLGGFPSRVRISPDGRYGATTVFVAGHSYAEAGFSTETTLINLETGGRLGNLEDFALWRDGRRFRAVDVNFWGVTFARDGDHFYATVASGGRTYLVEGSVGERQMRTLRENVECPSLSPDGTRLAFKKQVSRLLRPVWRFHVLDLATKTETALAELRSIDDQIEWLDDRQVLYGDGSTVWVAAADGSGQPRKFLSQASSPTVLRSALPAAAGAAPEGSLSLRSADLAVAIAASPGDVAAGGLVSYAVTITNRGPADATSLKLDYLLPPDGTFAGPATATNPGQGYGCALHEDQRTSCDTGLLPNGGTWTVTLNVRAGAAGTFSPRAVVSGAEPDPQPANDSTVVHTTVRPAPK